jgi:hypothetical protein
MDASNEAEWGMTPCADRLKCGDVKSRGKGSNWVAGGWPKERARALRVDSSSQEVGCAQSCLARDGARPRAWWSDAS